MFMGKERERDRCGCGSKGLGPGSRIRTGWGVGGSFKGSLRCSYKVSIVTGSRGLHRQNRAAIHGSREFLV